MDCSPSSTDTGREGMGGRTDGYVSSHARTGTFSCIRAHTHTHILPHNVITLFARVLWYALLYRLLLQHGKACDEECHIRPVLHSASPFKTSLHAINESQREQHIFPGKNGARAPGVNNSHARGHARTHRLTVQAELKDISISARAGRQNPR